MEQGRSPGSGSGAHSALAPLTRRNRSSVRDAAAFKGVDLCPGVGVGGRRPKRGKLRASVDPGQWQPMKRCARGKPEGGSA